MHVVLSIGTAAKRPPNRSTDGRGPFLWAARLTAYGEAHTTVKQWYGAVNRTTPERAQAHAIAEGLLKLHRPGLSVTVHAARPPRLNGLSEVLEDLAARHVLTWTTGPDLGGKLRPVLKNFTPPHMRRALRGNAWVPLNLTRLDLHAALVPVPGGVALAEISHQGHATVLTTAACPFPFLGPHLEFAPGGLQVPGAAVREVMRASCEDPEVPPLGPETPGTVRPPSTPALMPTLLDTEF